MILPTVCIISHPVSTMYLRFEIYTLSFHCTYMQTFTISITGYEQLEKRAVKSGNGAAVPVPKRWLGRKVHCILVEEPEDEAEKD